MDTLLAHIDRVVAAQWVTTICDSNPASPISRFSGETVLSEEVPEGWRGDGVFQRATKPLLEFRGGFVAILSFASFFPCQISAARKNQL